MNKKQLIKRMNELFFIYGNSINDVINSKDLRLVKVFFDEFYEKYEELIKESGQ